MAASSTPLVWLITGTASGFGNCLVASVLARGDRVIATARSLESINHLQGNPNVCVRQLDVTAGAPAIAAIVAEAAGVWGRLDVVVNNAGAGYPGLLEEGGSDLLRKQFAVNFFGVMDVCAASLPFSTRTEVRHHRRGGQPLRVEAGASWTGYVTHLLNSC
ncbi:hypothetical protein B0H14DRAFT_1051347 [Mycena olivaceomarginata]|nr:hypothetical protein B0H14DRAFT_1051347 [Mycena olivaceomarginata]